MTENVKRAAFRPSWRRETPHIDTEDYVDARGDFLHGQFLQERHTVDIPVRGTGQLKRHVRSAVDRR